MAFKILIGNETRKIPDRTIDDEIMAIAYIFTVMTEKGIPAENIYVHNTETGETQDLNQWTGTPKGHPII